MLGLTRDQTRIIRASKTKLKEFLLNNQINVRLLHDFEIYLWVRATNGDHNFNQVFDIRYANLEADDFWLLATNKIGEPIATYCLRWFIVSDFYDLIRSLVLWFPNHHCEADPNFVVDCGIPPFGGEIIHGGGLWIRNDYRGASRLAGVMPRLARVIALGVRPFAHDTAMIRNDPSDSRELADRKAGYMGKKVYGFARVSRFVDGWFPPEGRDAIMHLCHASRSEAIASLVPRAEPATVSRLTKFGDRSLINQHDQPIHPPPVLRQRQEQARI